MATSVSGLPGKMTAVQVVEYHKPWKINQVDTPSKIGEYDLLVKTAVASLCHTDSMVLEGMFPTGLPRTGSHEGTGTVVEVGSKVQGFKKGDRVMSGIPKGACNSCINCAGEIDPSKTFSRSTHPEQVQTIGTNTVKMSKGCLGL